MYFSALFLITTLFPTLPLKKKQVKESGKKNIYLHKLRRFAKLYSKNGHPWHLTDVPVNVNAAQVSGTT